MHRHTRREFLTHAAVAGGAMALSPVAAPTAQDKPVAMTIARWKAEPGAYPDEMKTLATRLTEQAIAGLGAQSRPAPGGVA